MPYYSSIFAFCPDQSDWVARKLMEQRGRAKLAV